MYTYLSRIIFMKNMIHASALLALSLVFVPAYSNQDITELSPSEETTAKAPHKKSRQSVEDRLYHMERKVDGITVATTDIPSREDLNRLENKIDQLTSDILALRSEKSVLADLDTLEKMELNTSIAIEVAEITIPKEESLVLAEAIEAKLADQEVII